MSGTNNIGDALGERPYREELAMRKSIRATLMRRGSRALYSITAGAKRIGERASIRARDLEHRADSKELVDAAKVVFGKRILQELQGRIPRGTDLGDGWKYEGVRRWSGGMLVHDVVLKGVIPKGLEEPVDLRAHIYLNPVPARGEIFVRGETSEEIIIGKPHVEISRISKKQVEALLAKLKLRHPTRIMNVR